MGKKGKKGGGKAAAAAPQLSPALLADVPAPASSTAEDEEDAALHAELALTTELLLQVCALLQAAAKCVFLCECANSLCSISTCVWYGVPEQAMRCSLRPGSLGRQIACTDATSAATEPHVTPFLCTSSGAEAIGRVQSLLLFCAAQLNAQNQEWEPPKGDGALRGTPCVLGDGDLTSNSAFQSCLRRS